MNDLKLDGLTGKTIKEAEVDGFGIRMVFTDGAVFEYDASDGGYSQYELTEATAEAMQKQIDHTADIGKKASISCAHENDLISRQAARHALCKAVHKGEDIPCENQTASCLWTGTRVCDYVREIDALPSVQPERKTGYWIPVTHSRGGHECNRCHDYAPSYQNGDEYLANYCPNCGADMRGGDSNE